MSLNKMNKTIIGLVINLLTLCLLVIYSNAWASEFIIANAQQAANLVSNRYNYDSINQSPFYTDNGTFTATAIINTSGQVSVTLTAPANFQRPAAILVFRNNYTSSNLVASNNNLQGTNSGSVVFPPEQADYLIVLFTSSADNRNVFFYMNNTVQVRPAPASITNISFSTTSPVVGQTVRTTVTTSSTPHLVRIRYSSAGEWFSMTGSGTTRTHDRIFETSGTKSIEIQVLDNQNRVIDSAFRSLSVSDPAPASITNISFSTTSPVVGQTVRTTVTTSSTPHLVRIRYSSVGEWFSMTGSGTTRTHDRIFETSGTKSIEMQVLDNQNRVVDSAFRSLSVSEPVGSNAQVTSINFSNTAPLLGESVRTTARTDTNAHRVEINYLSGGNWFAMQGSGTTWTDDRTYDSPGSKTITVRTINANGQEVHRRTATLSVLTPSVTHITPTQAVQGEQTIFTLTGSNLPNNMAANIEGSTGHCTQLTYTTTQVTMQCVAQVLGSKRFYLKDKPDGTTIAGSENWIIQVRTATTDLPSFVAPPSIVGVGTNVNEFHFRVDLTASLPSGFEVALNFDNLQGGWFTPQQAGGRVPMSCSGTICTAIRQLDQPGLRAFRAGIFEVNGELVGAYSGSATCTRSECIAAVMAPNRIGDPALSGSGSQLIRGVDVATGNYHLSSIDLSVSGKGPNFVLMRAYNGLNTSWSFNLDARAAFVANSYNRRITIAPREDGRTATFFKDMDDYWYTLNPGNFDQLVEEADGRFTLYTQGNLLYRFANPTGAGAGRLEAIEDRDGNVLTFGHTTNRIVSATDASGRSYTLTRDSSGRITGVSDFAGRSVQYTWTAAGITAVRNPRNQSTTYAYSGQQLTTITDPRGNVQMSIAYVASGIHAGKVASVTDGAGNEWSYTYTTTLDAQGRHGTGVTRPTTHGVNNSLVFVIDAERTRVLERVDSVNAGDFRRRNDFASVTNRQRIAEAALVNRSEQPNGAATVIVYENDGTGNPQTITASGSGVSSMTTQLEWTTVGTQINLTPMQSVLRPGVASSTQFSDFTVSGQARTIVNPLGQSTARAFNAVGLMTSSTDARGGTTSIQYDTQGRPTQVTNPLNHTTATTYDALGRVIRVTNARGQATNYTYDANGNVLTITDALGGVTTHTYDASDNLVQIIDPRGHTTSYSYDSLNRKVSETYTIGGQERTRHFAYDAMGRLHRVTNEKGQVSENRFDARGNTLQKINPLSQTVTYTYDANGNVASVTDAAGRQVSYQYDALNRRTRVTDALGNTEHYTYNAQGLLASKRDARNQLTQYEYDALGRMTKVIDPDGGETRATYDANGNLTSTTDRKGQTVTYTYDAANRMTRLTDAMNRQWNFTYDANGNLLSRRMPDNSVIHYTYDALDRVSSVNYPGGPNVTYTYDANGNRLSMVDGNGTATYSYDEVNRLVSMNDAFGNSVAWRYDAAGLLDRLTYPGNRNVTYSYDAAGRMSSLSDWLNHTTSYTRDASGAVKRIGYGNGAEVTFDHDAAGRLIQLINRNGAGGVISSHGLQLDGVGNPTSATLELPLLPTDLGRAAEMLYDASNRMTHVDGVALTHDNLGRLTQDPSGGDPIQYAYNAQDLITGVTRGGVLTDAYVYDGDGRRVARTSGGQTTRYVLDPTGGDLYRLLAETNSTNTVQHYYIYGASGLISQISGSSHRYYHFDQTGNTVALTSSSGEVTDTYAYEPFGNTTAQGSSHNPFRFVGQYGVMDDGNGLHHMRARYYRPDLRRFVSLDALYGQIDDPMTLNRYQYVSGNPMVGIDPSGYQVASIQDERALQMMRDLRALHIMRKLRDERMTENLNESSVIKDSLVASVPTESSGIVAAATTYGRQGSMGVVKSYLTQTACNAVGDHIVQGYIGQRVNENVENVHEACSIVSDASNPGYVFFTYGRQLYSIYDEGFINAGEHELSKRLQDLSDSVSKSDTHHEFVNNTPVNIHLRNEMAVSPSTSASIIFGGVARIYNIFPKFHK